MLKFVTDLRNDVVSSEAEALSEGSYSLSTVGLSARSLSYLAVPSEGSPGADAARRSDRSAADMFSGPEGAVAVVVLTCLASSTVILFHGPPR